MIPIRTSEARATRRAGFTLVETLAALTIAALIIVAMTALVHDVALHFDRGTRAVGEAERLMLASERMAADFASTRFVERTTEEGAELAFTGEPAGDVTPAKIMLVGAAGVGTPGEEAIALTIEEGDDLARLVRRRAPWTGPRARFEDLDLRDPVVLIEGRYDMAFAFAALSPLGEITWKESWTHASFLPRFVRLSIKDRATGGDVLPGAEFIVKSDVPLICARAGTGCLAAGLHRDQRGSH